MPGLYHIRLFHIRAPLTAGLYHFKIYVDGESVGEGNFPITIAKSGLEPAYISGRVSLRGLPPTTLVSGRVTATGVTRKGTYAEAVAYFGPGDFETADDQASYYRYWLFGLPAGTFDLTASASGFLKASWRVAVNDGQSLTPPDFELERGVEIQLTIWSKDQSGPIPWANLWQLPYGTNDPYLSIDDEGPHRDILIRLFDRYEEAVGYWASDDIDAPYGPPWSVATVDGKREYSPLVLKPSTLPSSNSYTVTLTDNRSLPAIRLDGHVPADAADLIEGVTEGFYTVEIQVTGYVMREADDWQRSLAIAQSTRTYSLEVDLRRSSWIMASAIIVDELSRPLSPATLAIVANSTDNFERGLAVGTFPAGASRFTMVLEGFNGAYNRLRTSVDYQDYGLEPIDYRLEAYMADVGTPYTGDRGAGWYIADEPKPELRINPGSGSVPAVFRLEAASISLLLRSIRLDDPPDRTPWTFPGAAIRVYFIDELGNPAAMLDPIFYGLVQDDGTITDDPYDVDTSDVGYHGLLEVTFTGIDPRPDGALSGFYPTRLEEGRYSVNVATFGYVQREDHSTYVLPSMRNDLKVDLVQGAQIRVELEFRHEGEPTEFSGFARVEVYNQQGTFVGASIYAGADPNPNVTYFPYDASKDWKLTPGAAEGAGTGLEPQRAFFSQLCYGIPAVTWADWPAMTPSDANRLSMPSGASVAYDVFGFHSYHGASDSRRDGLWASGWDTTDGAGQVDAGIRGSRDALDLEGWGNFTVRVWAFDPYGPDGAFDSTGRDGVFGTEDDYTSLDAVDGGLSDFRAYAQTTDVTSVEVPWGGAATVRVTLDDLPSLLGVVYWIDMYGNLRTLPWAQVIDRSPDGIWTSSATGRYRLWLSEGSHEIFVTTIGEEQLWQPVSFEIMIPGPGVHTFRDVTLTTASTAVPEFTGLTGAALVPMAAPLILLSKRQSRRTRSELQAN
ncbi:carboxypeptidase-like regulatory domain-containing protein [[Eubacterium] cellulosolvens]